MCEVAVYRSYCHNPQCAKAASPTCRRAGRYRPDRMEVHPLAVQMYAWAIDLPPHGRSVRGGQPDRRAVVERRVLTVAGGGLVWHRQVEWAAGVDEKYALVPRNDKPRAMRRWMYVDLAVDASTYDLFGSRLRRQHLGQRPAFLLALRAKATIRRR